MVRRMLGVGCPTVATNVPRVNEGAHKNAASVPETKMKIRMRNVTQNTNRALSFNPMLAAALSLSLNLSICII